MTISQGHFFPFTHCPPTRGVLEKFLSLYLTGPTIVFRLVAAMASRTLALSRVCALLRASATISKAAYLNPIGCVHSFFVFAVQASQMSLEVLPEREDLKGWLGLHQISEVRRFGRSPPNAPTAAGKRIAFAMVATLGMNPC